MHTPAAHRLAAGALFVCEKYLHLLRQNDKLQMEDATMIFEPYIGTENDDKVPVVIRKMRKTDAEQTKRNPAWQTDWTSSYITTSPYEKYAVQTVDGELVALGMYEVLENALVVRVIYMESQPESNPTLARENRKYYGIGKLMIAYGIKLSIDYGFGGDVILEAKTDKLAEHYRDDFGGLELPAFDGGAPRFLIQGEAAKRIFFSYLK